MEKEQKSELIKIIAAAVLLAAVWVVTASVDMVWYVRLALFLIPYLLVGGEVLLSAAKNILHGEVFDECFLMGLATIGAFCIGEYPEAVAVMLFYAVGEWFQDVSVDRSRRSIEDLMDIRPDTATVIRDGAEITVAAQDVRPGEIMVCRPGERIPLDGVIVEGSTSVNTAALTGEALPRDRGVGESVVSGTVNLSGVIKAEVKSAYAESTVARILDLVENSADKKAAAESFITKFARWYTPCVVIGAVLLAFLPPLIVGQALADWVRRALVFLVVSCPCALVVSVPLTFFAGIGGASRRGILIKGANYIETLANVKTVVFDKTGTLTQGTFSVTAVHPEKESEAALLDMAAAAESYSSHPIAESIVRAHGGHIDKARIASVEELPGLGVRAVIDGHSVCAGNGRLMESAGAGWHECHIPGTAVHISVDGEYMGHIIISDTVKPDSARAIGELKSLGVRRTVMLTGDTEQVGAAVAAELGLDEYRAGLLPEGKVTALEELLAGAQRGESLAFVGDGINDAPVLTRADIGIAMGALGSDAAIEAADVVLMDDKPSKVASAIAAARRIMGIVRQNIVFAIAVKIMILILGALGVAGMWLAVFADVGVTVIAVLNSMRAMSLK